MALPRRTVITGIGVLTPLGLGRDAYWDGLRAGHSGVRPIRNFDPTGLPAPFGGEIESFDARNYLDKKERKRLNVMPRGVQLAVAASQLALQDAALEKGRLDPTRFGVIFGSSTIPSEMIDMGPASVTCTDTAAARVDYARWGEQGLAKLAPMWLLLYVPNMAACHVSILHDAQGPCNTITQSDVASLLALGEAFRALSRGQADVFLVGGGDTKMNPVSTTRHTKFSELSRRVDAPEKASRPFDRSRDGQVLGEGAGVLVVEELEHARRRGARIYAEVVGFSAAFDRGRQGHGLARAVRAALAEAGAGPEDLDHVNAHGYSSVPGDAWEARGLGEGLGPEPVPVFAPKSYLGNIGAGASIVELAASILAFEHDLLPASLNYDEPDLACPVAVAAEPRPVTRPCVLKVGLTELGQCAAVVCRKWP
jgi:3-oxoacyl-[acyl-carrier-protein] synthase II